MRERADGRHKVVILGGGPNRIGQGIEFDYCCCHACFALGDAGFETIMINCNPETVSTDYDTSDRLYFEPLTAEDVLEVLHKEKEKGKLAGVIVQFGGQTPLKLARALEDAGIPILGTSPDTIDLAEDRERFAELVEQLGLKQPENGIARSRDEAIAVASRIGYPVLMRPSYVLGGRAMEIVETPAQLDTYIREAVIVSGDAPVLIDRYLRDAIEVDVDALCDGETVYVAGVLQHIEEAGVHSGDSACSLPPYSLPADIIAEIERQTAMLAKALNVSGLMNIQFAVKDGEVYLIEVNPRASRTVPFVAKAIGIQVAKIASRVMAGEKLSSFDLSPPQHRHPYRGQGSGVPVRALPRRRSGARPRNEIDRRSHGHRRRFRHRLRQGAVRRRHACCRKRAPCSSRSRTATSTLILPAARELVGLGFTLIATDGTARTLEAAGLPVDAGQQGRRRPAAYRRPDQGRRYRADLQHHRGRAVAEGLRPPSARRRFTAGFRTSPRRRLRSLRSAAIAALRRRPLEVRPLQAYHHSTQGLRSFRTVSDPEKVELPPWVKSHRNG